MGHIEAMRIPEDKKKVKAFRISEALANLHDEKSGDRQPKSIPVIDSTDSSSSLLIKTNNNQDAPIGGDQTMASTSTSTSVNPRLRPKPKPSSNIVRFDSKVVTPLIPSSSLQQPIMVGNSLRSSAFKPYSSTNSAKGSVSARSSTGKAADDEKFNTKEANRTLMQQFDDATTTTMDGMENNNNILVDWDPFGDAPYDERRRRRLLSTSTRRRLTMDDGDGDDEDDGSFGKCFDQLPRISVTSTTNNKHHSGTTNMVSVADTGDEVANIDFDEEDPFGGAPFEEPISLTRFGENIEEIWSNSDAVFTNNKLSSNIEEEENMEEETSEKEDVKGANKRFNYEHFDGDGDDGDNGTNTKFVDQQRYESSSSSASSLLNKPNQWNYSTTNQIINNSRKYSTEILLLNANTNPFTSINAFHHIPPPTLQQQPTTAHSREFIPQQATTTTIETCTLGGKLGEGIRAADLSCVQTTSTAIKQPFQRDEEDNRRNDIRFEIIQSPPKHKSPKQKQHKKSSFKRKVSTSTSSSSSSSPSCTEDEQESPQTDDSAAEMMFSGSSSNETKAKLSPYASKKQSSSVVTTSTTTSVKLSPLLKKYSGKQRCGGNATRQGIMDDSTSSSFINSTFQAEAEDCDNNSTQTNQAAATTTTATALIYSQSSSTNTNSLN